MSIVFQFDVGKIQIDAFVSFFESFRWFAKSKSKTSIGILLMNRLVDYAIDSYRPKG